jgi:hypothetical protein
LKRSELTQVDGQGKSDRFPGEILRKKIGSLLRKRAFVPGCRISARYLRGQSLPSLSVKGKKNFDESLVTGHDPAEPEAGLK